MKNIKIPILHEPVLMFMLKLKLDLSSFNIL